MELFQVRHFLTKGVFIIDNVFRVFTTAFCLGHSCANWTEETFSLPIFFQTKTSKTWKEETQPVETHIPEFQQTGTRLTSSDKNVDSLGSSSDWVKARVVSHFRHGISLWALKWRQSRGRQKPRSGNHAEEMINQGLFPVVNRLRFKALTGWWKILENLGDGLRRA